MTDRVSQLIQSYRGLGDAADEAPQQIDIILELEGLPDSRVLPFLLRVIRNIGEYDLARIEALKVVQSMEIQDIRLINQAGRVVMHVLKADPDDDVRDYAAMAMSNLMRADGALAEVGRVLTDPATDRNLRHNAFFALERCGPTAGSVALLERLLDDSELGQAAHRVRDSWAADSKVS